MKKLLNTILLTLLVITSVTAGLPPTTSKINGDATKKTTFDYEFPNFTGTHTGTKVAITGGTDFTFSGDLTLSGANFNSSRIGQSLSYQAKTGVISGGTLSINGGNPALFDMSAVTLQFSDYTSSLTNPVIRTVTCSSQTGVSALNIATQGSTYAYINPSCVIIKANTPQTPAERRANAFVGKLSHTNNTSITTALSIPDLVVDTNSQFYDLLDAVGQFNVSGNVISPNGANLSFNKSAGSVFRRSSNFSTSTQSPHIKTLAATMPTTFLRITQTNLNLTPVTTLDVANYDVAGVVTAIPGGSNVSTNQRIFIFPDGNVGTQYGQITYTSLGNAIAGIPAETYTINPTAADGGILVAVISCTKSATAINNATNCNITKVGRFDQSGVSVGSTSPATFQSTYDNSATPQVTTSTASGSVDFKRGSAADTDNVFRIQNGAGTATATFTGAGAVTGSSLALGGALTSGTMFSASSTTAAVIFPRMTTAQKNALTPVAGMELYDSDLNIKQYYNGSQWVANTSIQLDNVYSAKVSSTGVVSGENKDWISGNCTNANPFVCTFTSNIFSVAPSCVVSVGTNNNRGVQVSSISSSSISVTQFQTSTGSNFQDTNWTINCQKSSPDYQSADAYIASNGNTDWASYTPTYTGWGAVSTSNMKWKRVGDTLHIRGSFISGSPTASEARISLPSGLTSVSTITTLEVAGGNIGGNLNAGSGRTLVPLIEPSQTYLTFGYIDPSSVLSILAKANGNALASSAITISFSAEVPISGWTNSNLIVASLAGTPNVPGLSTAVDTFSINFGTTSASTNCTASPCSFLDQIGTAVSSVTRSSTGVYAMNTAKTYTKLKCTTLFNKSGTNLVNSFGTTNSCSNCNSLAIQAADNTTFVDASGMVMCQGSY